MTLKITLNLDNAAYSDDGTYISHAMRDIAHTFDHVPSRSGIPKAGWERKIIDINGNTVGKVEITL